MNRRLWIVLGAVVALLTVAPHVPAWLPLVWSALRSADYAALARTLLRQPWLIPACGAVSGVLLLAMLVHAVRRRRAASTLPSVVPARVRVTARPDALPTAVPAPQPMEAAPAGDSRWMRNGSDPVAPARAAGAAVATAATAPRRAGRSRISARRESVQRLSQQGRSVVEIARATRIGQDGIRLLVSLPRPVADAR